MNFSFNTNSLGGYKVRRQKFGIGSLMILVVMGVVALGVGIITMKASKIDPSWQHVTGRINDYSSNVDTTDNTKTYRAIVDYEVDGESYQIKSSFGNSSIPVKGDPKEVAYNPNDPNDAKVVDGAGGFVGWVIMAFGAGFLVAAPILFVRARHRSEAIQNLTQSGQKLQGVIIDIQSYGSTNSGVDETRGSNSYKIVVAATDSSGSVQNYVSDTLTGIGGLAMADFRNNPIPIDVYLDPTNPQNYYVDVSDVPNLTPERIRGLIESAVKTTQPQSIANFQQQPNGQQAQAPFQAQSQQAPAPASQTPPIPTPIQPVAPQAQPTSPQAPPVPIVPAPTAQENVGNQTPPSQSIQ